jgi:hypothetical protein
MWLRDARGDYYVITEQQIRASRATAEQEAVLRDEIGEQDVAGYFGGFSPVGTINIVVAPQINNLVGLNIAAGTFAPVQQVLGQGAENALAAEQRR